MYKSARKGEGLSINSAASGLFIAPRTLSKYESGELVPPPEVVLGMSRLYRVPGMTQRYCRKCCAIGRAYSYEVLDNVNMDPATVLLKLVSEYREAGQVLDRMMELTVNRTSRKDFNDSEWHEYIRCMLEFLDLEHNIECLKVSISNWCDVGVLVEEHNQKCRDRGYVSKDRHKKTAV